MALSEVFGKGHGGLGRTPAAGHWRPRFPLQWQVRVGWAIEVFGLVAVLIVLPVEARAALAFLLVSAAVLRIGAPRLALSTMDDIPSVLTRIMASAGVVAATVELLGHTPAAFAVVQAGLLSVAVVLVLRAATNQAFRTMRSHYSWARGRAVIVGSGEVAQQVGRLLRERKHLGLDVVGYFDDEATGTAAHRKPALRRIGPLDAFAAYMTNSRATTVIFAYSRQRESELLRHVRVASAWGYGTYVVPRFFDATDRATASESVWGLPLVRIKSPKHGTQRLIKRWIDICVSGFALLLSVPIVAVVAILLPRETRAGLLFRQVRIGEGGRPFELLKFQTMKPATAAEGDTRWNIKEDQRLGRIGRFMRKASLDEIPQFWNVLRGDMSLVGPRPERPVFVDEFTLNFGHYADRHRMPVGITGWAQIHRMRGDTSISDRARLDNAYCDSWNLWEDIKIMARTIPELVKAAGG